MDEEEAEEEAKLSRKRSIEERQASMRGCGWLTEWEEEDARSGEAVRPRETPRDGREAVTAAIEFKVLNEDFDAY